MITGVLRHRQEINVPRKTQKWVSILCCLTIDKPVPYRSVATIHKRSLFTLMNARTRTSSRCMLDVSRAPWKIFCQRP